jgi:predicted N-acetyltransferase YhbS
MGDTVIRLSAGDYEPCTAFLDRVFAEHRPHDFKALLPTIYRPTDAHMRHNLAVKRHGDLVAVVGLFPMTLHLGGTPLRVAGIGGVSVDPAYRGDGLMRLLMDEAMADIRANYDLGWLGGQRQRYGYFGFERCGAELTFTVDLRSIKHLAQLVGLPAAALTIWDHDAKRIAEPLPNDSDAWPALETARRKRPIWCARDDEPWHWTTAHHASPTLLRDQRGGEPAGLIVARNDGVEVTEWFGVGGDHDPRGDTSTLAAALSYVNMNTRRFVNFVSAPLPDAVNTAMSHWADLSKTTDSGNWCVVDWAKVVGAALRLRHGVAGAPLPDGEAVVRVRGATPVTLRLSVSGANAEVERLDDRGDAFTLGPMAMMRTLFGPGPAAMGTFEAGAAQRIPPGAAALHAWCPLPLFLPRPDHV